MTDDRIPGGYSDNPTKDDAPSPEMATDDPRNDAALSDAQEATNAESAPPDGDGELGASSVPPPPP